MGSIPRPARVSPLVGSSRAAEPAGCVSRKTPAVKHWRAITEVGEPPAERGGAEQDEGGV